ncbi:hypothetical protein PTKIN_Ptkin03bG0000100 [Pterospermum kingtungense]
MAYRRRHQQQQQEIFASAAADDLVDATKAIRASSAHKDSSFSSAYGYGSLRSSSASSFPTVTTTPEDFQSHEYTSMKSLNESKQGFWGSLARKAKSFLDDDNVQHQFESDERSEPKLPQKPSPEKYHNIYQSNDRNQKTGNPKLQKGLAAIASSLNYIGNAVEIRLQLETLLAEKARLACENSIYARENRFLREVVEYHQLTMQDVVYLDESTEEVTEVYPIKVPSLPNMNSMPATSGALPYEAPLDTSLQITRNISVRPVPPPEFADGSQNSAWPSSRAQL